MAVAIVLGGTSNAPENALVLGGIQGAQQRYKNPDPKVRINAISQALNYGEDGVNLLLQALTTDESADVKDVAYNLLHSKYGKLIEFVNAYQVALRDRPSYAGLFREVGDIVLTQTLTLQVTAITFSLKSMLWQTQVIV